MTTMTNRIEELFQDARELQADALELLAQGDVRNAAEKAWGATKRATAALVLARTGEELDLPAELGLGLRQVQAGDEAVRQARLAGRYYTRQVQLHGECFYNGLCDPGEDTARRVRETSRYIGDAERLAADPPEDQPDVLQESLSIIFGVDIRRIIKYLGDPPEFYMETAQGNITLGTIDKIYSQTKFRQAVGAATGIVIQKVPGNIWEQRVQAILSACEEIEAGEGILRERETRRWVEDYLLEKPPREEDWEKAVGLKSPFVKDGTTHMFVDDFRRWLEFPGGRQLGKYRICRRLRQVGMEPKQVNAHISGARTTRTTWVVPGDCLPGRNAQRGQQR